MLIASNASNAGTKKKRGRRRPEKSCKLRPRSRTYYDSDSRRGPEQRQRALGRTAASRPDVTRCSVACVDSRTAARVATLRIAAEQPEHQRHGEQHQEDEEQHLRDFDGAGGDAPKAE